MQNIDDLLKQQRDLIIQMDQHHQRQMKSLQDRIARVEAQIQSAVAQKEDSNAHQGRNIQLSKNDATQKSDIVIDKSKLTPNPKPAHPSPSQNKLPRLSDQGHF